MYVRLQHPTELEQMLVLQQTQAPPVFSQAQYSTNTWQTSMQTPQQQILKLQELLHFESQWQMGGPMGPSSTTQPLPSQCFHTEMSMPQMSGPNPQSAARHGENDEFNPGDPWPEIEDVNEILNLAMAKLPYLAASQLVSCIHSVAKLCEQDASPPNDFSMDPRIKAILESLRMKAKELAAPRSMMRVVWALGKLGVKGTDVEGIISEFGTLAPPRLAHFSPQELSNMLWGLARMAETSKSQHGVTLAHAVMREGARRLTTFSTQCLTNSLWAVAKLGLRGEEVAVFTRECVLQIHSVIFKEMSPQGLANSLWACAKIQCDGREGPILENEIVTHFCMDAARRATASEDLLKLFFPQELSMALWGMAKLMGRRNRPAFHLEDDIERFAMAVAREGCLRIHDFSAQGVSIVAWALATLNLVEAPDALQFFEVAAEVASRNIQTYPPQAIANLCWALNRVPGKPAVLVRFGRAAALEAQQRMDDFSWQDSSGIVSALMTLGPESAEVRDLTILLVQNASVQCHRIGTQALLNIALSAVRLKLDPVAVVTPLANGIAQAFVKRQGLNDIDLRQWQEVQRYCGFITGLAVRKGKKSKKKS